MKCSKCGSKDIDFQESGGQSICVNCGTVLEENTIVSSIEFQESGDRSHVVGQFVSASCSKPYMSGARGMGRHGDSRDSRDTTLVNARRAISQVAISLRLPNLYVDRAYRLYQLALQRNFIFGRRQAHVVATCLYIICRQEKSPHLLIDFSDALQVNVYVLGKSFLQFSKILNLNLPVVDPSLYIHRYATRLELGEKMSGVVTTALRIVTRLKKDWIATGRRPDGICAVALLIATRAYGFNISQGVVAKIFRISGDTLKRRLDDFRATPSAQLTLVQFNLNDLDVEFDPPAFIRNVVDGAGDPGSIALSLTSSDQNALDSEGEEPKDLEEDEVFRSVPLRIGEVDVEVPVPGQSTAKALSASAKSKEAARSALYSTIYSQAMLDASAQANEQHVDALLNEAQLLEGVKPPKSIDEKKRKRPAAASASKASSAKMNRPTALLVGHTAHIDLTAVNEGDEDQLLPEILDTDDNSYLLTQDEQQKRSSIWEKNFRPFMDERDRRRQARERENGESSDKYTINGKLRKKYTKRLVVDANTTTSHSVLSTGASVKGSSKKINYDALKGVFGGDGGFAAPEALNKAAVVNNKVAQVKAPPTSKLSGTTVADNTKKSSDVANSVTFSSATVDNSKAKSVAVADEPDDEEEDNLMYEDEGNGGDYEYDDDYY